MYTIHNTQYTLQSFFSSNGMNIDTISRVLVVIFEVCMREMFKDTSLEIQYLAKAIQLEKNLILNLEII